jgi:hypothetical protein
MLYPQGGTAITMAKDPFLDAFQSECMWLRHYLSRIEAGELKITRDGDGRAEDVTLQVAGDYRHRLGNLEGFIQAYERARRA